MQPARDLRQGNAKSKGVVVELTDVLRGVAGEKVECARVDKLIRFPPASTAVGGQMSQAWVDGSTKAS